MRLHLCCVCCTLMCMYVLCIEGFRPIREEGVSSEGGKRRTVARTTRETNCCPDSGKSEHVSIITVGIELVNTSTFPLTHPPHTLSFTHTHTHTPSHFPPHHTQSSKTVTVLGPGNMTLPSEPHPPKLTNHITEDVPMSDKLEAIADSSRGTER